MEQTKHRTFRRADGVLGVGFVMAFAGVQQASIAWPDRQAERHLADELGRHGIEELGTKPGKPAETVTVAEQVVAGGEAIAGVEAPESDPAQETQARRERRESEAKQLRDYLTANGTEMQAKDVVAAMKELGVEVTPQQVSHAKAAVKAAAENSDTKPAAEPPQPITDEQAIRNYLAEHGTGATNKAIIAALKSQGLTVSSSQVSRIKAAFGSEASE